MFESSERTILFPSSCSVDGQHKPSIVVIVVEKSDAMRINDRIANHFHQEGTNEDMHLNVSHYSTTYPLFSRPTSNRIDT